MALASVVPFARASARLLRESLEVSWRHWQELQWTHTREIDTAGDGIPFVHLFSTLRQPRHPVWLWRSGVKRARPCQCPPRGPLSALPHTHAPPYIDTSVPIGLLLMLSIRSLRGFA